MLTLLLLRHAKAEPGRATLADQDRSLAPRGKMDAPKLGRFIAREKLVPDLVLCSSARRTRETWALVEPEFGAAVEMHFEPGIYEATTARLLAIVRRTPPMVKRLMLIGHNPGLEELTDDLMGVGDANSEASHRLSEKYPTAGLAVLEFAHDQWARVTPRSSRLVAFTAPKYLD